MPIIIPQKTIHKNGIKNKVGSKSTLAVEVIIKAGKVVCIKNLETTFPSFSEIKLYFFNKKPIEIIAKVILKT